MSFLRFKNEFCINVGQNFARSMASALCFMRLRELSLIIKIIQSALEKKVVLSDFSTERYNLKKLARLFQVAIHFHPGPSQLKTLIDSFDTLIR